MPYDEVMGKYKRGQLHSGSKSGPKVKSRAQAVAIMLSEKREAKAGKKEYKSLGKGSGAVGPGGAVGWAPHWSIKPKKPKNTKGILGK